MMWLQGRRCGDFRASCARLPGSKSRAYVFSVSLREMFVDSHAHLDGERFDADRDQVIARAQEAGVRTIVAIGTGDGPGTLDCAVRSAEQYDSLYATVGIHP